MRVCAGCLQSARYVRDRAVLTICSSDNCVFFLSCEGSGLGGDSELDGLFLDLYDFLLTVLDEVIVLV